MTPRPVRHAGRIPPYVPGRSLDDVCRETGLEPARIVKLASNENPLGPPPAAIDAARDALDRLHLYPDGSGAPLRRKLSDKLGVPADWIILGNGSSDIIDLAARSYLEPGRTAWIAPRSFALYRRVALAAGVNVKEIMPVPEHWRQAAADTGGPGVAFVADPDNPTAQGLPDGGAGALLDALPPDWVLVVDEAYREYDPPDRMDAVALLKQSGAKHLLVTRTFSKAYGLAGLRVGYGIAHPDLLATLHRFRLPINITGPALAACEAALADDGHIARSRNMVAGQREGLKARLADMGYEATGDRGNFLLVKCGRPAAPLVTALLKQGVVVRPLDAYGLPDAFRVTIGLPDQMDRFLFALSGCRGEE